MTVEREEVSPDGTRRYQKISLEPTGDLTWYCHDLGPGPGFLMAGSREYEFARTIRAAHLDTLARALGVAIADLPARLDRDFRSDVELDVLARAHDIPTEFWSWISSPDD